MVLVMFGVMMQVRHLYETQENYLVKLSTSVRYAAWKGNEMAYSVRYDSSCLPGRPGRDSKDNGTQQQDDPPSESPRSA